MQFFHKHRSLIYKIILFLISIDLFSLPFSTQWSFKYSYQTGKPSNTKLCSFDFPISKSDEELTAERISIEQESPLVFTMDTLAEQRSFERTRKWIRQQGNSISSSAFNGHGNVTYQSLLTWSNRPLFSASTKPILLIKITLDKN